MITDRSPDGVSQLRKSKTTTKRRLWITEAFVSEPILFTCGNSACERGAFVPPPGLCVSRSSQSRAEHRKPISLWTSGRPRPSRYLSLSCVSERCSLCTRARGGVASGGRRSDVGSGGDEMCSFFSPWVRRTTLQSVYITTVFFFLTIFLGILFIVLKPSLPINATLCL